MMLSASKERKVVKAILAGDDSYQVVGKTCDGPYWPEGDHYYIINDLINQETLHIPVETLGEDFLSDDDN